MLTGISARKIIQSATASLILSGLLSFSAISCFAQVIDPAKSANAAAVSDTRFIASSIAYNEDVIFLSRKAIDRGVDERVKELAQQMQEDHSGMLYTMEQLKAAGTGSSTQTAPSTDAVHEQAAALNGKLSGVSGADFDTLWVSSLLVMNQKKYDELIPSKETVRNPQLKMAVTEAIPLIRKHLSQLKSLQKYLIRMAIQKKREAAQQAR